MKYIKYYISIACLLCCMPTYIISSAAHGSSITRGSSPCLPVKLEPENKELFVLLRQGEIGLLKEFETIRKKYNKLVALFKKDPHELQTELLKTKQENDRLIKRCGAFQQSLNEWKILYTKIEKSLEASEEISKQRGISLEEANKQLSDWDTYCDSLKNKIKNMKQLLKLKSEESEELTQLRAFYRTMRDVVLPVIKNERILYRKTFQFFKVMRFFL